jgi:hypothetical protein
VTAPNLSDAERLADLRCRVAGYLELLGADELAALELVAQGLARGHGVYGELQLETDTRDMRREAMEELRDSMTYTAAALLRLQRGRTP